MPDSIIDPLSDGNANGSSRGSSLGLNSTGDNQEQQVVTGVPPPGQPATAGNGEQTGIPPALLVGGVVASKVLANRAEILAKSDRPMTSLVIEARMD